MSEESAIEFPCDFPIKMMGRDTPAFRQTMRTLVEGHVGAVDDSRVQSTVSRNATLRVRHDYDHGDQPAATRCYLSRRFRARRRANGTVTRAAGQVIVVRNLGRQDYVPLWRSMQQFTDERTAATPDEIWFTEHPPVFTMGLNAKPEHLLAPGDIPVVQIDRGGQVTFHGIGQLMIYPLLDLRRAAIGVRTLVTALEQSVVDLVRRVRYRSRCAHGSAGRLRQ